MRGTRGLAGLAVLLLLAGCGGGAPPAGETRAAAATPQGAQARVVDVVNEVDAHPLEEGEWEDALVDMIIYVGGEVWAQEASTARVGVEEGLVRVAPNTVFTFEEPETGRTLLELDEGQVWVNVEGLEAGDTFEVETPAAVASVRGTRFAVRAEGDGTTIVSTQVGTVTVAAETYTVTVRAGHETTVAPGERPRNPESMSLEEQIRWGMAAGTGLDVVLPAVGSLEVVTQTGKVSLAQWSPSGDVLAWQYYDPESTDSQYAFYDLEAGAFFTMPLPTGVDGVAFSPAGDRLAYKADGAICAADSGGRDSSCFGQDIYGWPFWSPDGQWLLFYDWVGTAALNLFKVRPDGSDRTQLTFSDGGYNRSQSWSPDGSRIAHTVFTDYEEPADLWVMGSDGSGAGVIFQGTPWSSRAAWAPDGSLLAVPRHADAGGGLWLVRPDGSESWVVPGTEGWQCSGAVWSPTDDGWPLFFKGFDPVQDKQGEWYVPGREKEPQLLVTGSISFGPVWSGDGTRVAFGFLDPLADPFQTDVHLFHAEPGLWR